MSVQVPDQRPGYVPPNRDTIGDSIGQLSQLLAGPQKEQQAQQADKDQKAKARAAALIDRAKSLTPDQWREVRGKIVASDPDVAPYLPDMPTYTPSADENFKSMVTADNIKTFPTLPEGARKQGTFQNAYGAPMPADTVKETNAQDVYANKPSWATEMQPRQQIEDKTRQTANEVVTTGETSRHNKAEEGQTGPVRAAQAAKGFAETKKIKDDATAGPLVTNSVVDGVLTDPQSFFALPTDSKKAFVKATGRAPSKLAASEIDRMNAAKMGAQVLDDATAIVDKWAKRGAPITGPILGRFNEATGKWGDAGMLSGMFGGPSAPNLPPEQQKEYEQDIGQLRDWLGTLPVMEAKALAGGRTAYQVIQMVTSVSPTMSKGTEMFAGSVKGLQTRFAQIEDHMNKKQWGGKPPVSSTPDATGAGKSLDEATAKQFLQQAGGDKDKARQLAKAAGFNF